MIRLTSLRTTPGGIRLRLKDRLVGRRLISRRARTPGRPRCHWEGWCGAESLPRHPSDTRSPPPRALPADGRTGQGSASDVPLTRETFAGGSFAGPQYSFRSIALFLWRTARAVPVLPPAYDQRLPGGRRTKPDLTHQCQWEALPIFGSCSSRCWTYKSDIGGLMTGAPMTGL